MSIIDIEALELTMTIGVTISRWTLIWLTTLFEAFTGAASLTSSL